MLQPTEPLPVPDIGRLKSFLLGRCTESLFQKQTADTNVFRDLRLVWDERVDSRFIAWLLDPKQTHGQGTLFLSTFMDLCGLSDCCEALYDHTCAVETEFRGSEAHIDIMAVVTSKFLIYIENKLKSQEGHEQTQREYRDLQRQGEARDIPQEYRRAVYLTPSGDLPKGDAQGKWHAISHKALAESFQQVLGSVSDIRTRLLVEDWISICDGRLTDMEFSECAMTVIEHWEGAWDVLLAVDRFDHELTLLRAQLVEDLKQQEWWTRGWSVVSDKPGQLYVGHSSWKIGSKSVVWIGIDGFFSHCVLGPRHPAGLYVWVANGKTELVELLTKVIRQSNDQMIGEFDGKKNNVVRQLLPVCTESNSQTYLKDVRDQTLAFVGHYATLFRAEEPTLQNAVGKIRSKK